MQREDWAGLSLFAAIAEAGSFTRAAAGLGLSPSALSHAMRALETRLGLRLLHRTTRSVAPTEAGERLLATLRPAMADIGGTLAELESQRERPHGRLRITAHRTAAMQVLLPRLPAFARACPEVIVELAIEDGLVDIVAGRFDAGVRHEQMLEQDMVSVRLSEPQRIAIVATPEYFEAHGRPETPEALRHHRCLLYRYTSSGALHRWVFTRGGESFAFDPPAGFIANDVEVVLQAARAGMGVACVLEAQVAGSGLEQVLREWCPLVPSNYLYYLSRRQMSAALRAFIGAMRAGAT